MAFIQVNDKQIPVGTDEVSIGGHAGATIPIPQAGTAGPAALVRASSDGKAIIRRGDGGAPVKVNGLVLGIEPAPLIHGDKIEVAGVELNFAEEQKAGSTQFLSAAQLAELAAIRKAAGVGSGGKRTASTGGRLVSLVDGREYPVPAKGLMIGRDATCDVVIPSNDVSRNHAEIQSGPDGYYVIDLSTNGVFVNGARVEGTQTLGRADVLRLGTEEFRFYADTLSETPASAPATAAAGASAAVAMPSAPAPSPGDAPAQAPAARVSLPPLLATLEIINEGPTKGQKFEIRQPLTNIGRGTHNDFVIVDSSVSDHHAKIVRRDGEWYVQDQSSTNGTYVGGKRIEGEMRLAGAPDVRFGSVKLSFKPSASAPMEDKGTRVIAGMKATDSAPKRDTAEAAPARPAATPSTGGVPAIVWIIVGVVVVGAVAFFAMRGR